MSDSEPLPPPVDPAGFRLAPHDEPGTRRDLTPEDSEPKDPLPEPAPPPTKVDGLPLKLAPHAPPIRERPKEEAKPIVPQEQHRACVDCREVWPERMLEQEGSAWICRPCRQVRIDKAAAAKTNKGRFLARANIPDIPLWAKIAGIVAIITIVMLCIIAPEKVGPRKIDYAVEDWAKKGPDRWPPLVMAHQLQFRTQPMWTGGNAFLFQKKDGKLYAASGPLQLPLNYQTGGEVWKQLLSWRFAPSGTANPVTISGFEGGPATPLSGPLLFYTSDVRAETAPVMPLRCRKPPLTKDDIVFAVTTVGAPIGKAQATHKSKVMLGPGQSDEFSFEFDEPTPVDAVQGAPLVDDRGYVTGVVGRPGEALTPDRKAKKFVAVAAFMIRTMGGGP